MRIGFFGCGNMGSSLARGFKKKNSQIEQYFFTPSKDKSKSLALELGGNYVNSIVDMPTDLDWYILAFKPQSLADFSFQFSSNAKILSLLAGTGIETLEKKFKVKNIARFMPNTSSRIGEGANLIYTPFHLDELENYLHSLGKLFSMKSEDELDTITAFSGSGPALIFEYARLFERHLNLISGNNSSAKEIVAQTFLGSAKLMEEALSYGVSFETLRDQVTSKKGVTFEALSILEKNGLDNIMGGAFSAAYKRTLEIKKGI